MIHQDTFGCLRIHWDALGCFRIHWDTLGYIRDALAYTRISSSRRSPSPKQGHICYVDGVAHFCEKKNKNK